MTTHELYEVLDAAREAQTVADAKVAAAEAAWIESAVADKLAEFEAMGGVLNVTRVRRVWRSLGEAAAGVPPSADMAEGPFVVSGAYKLDMSDAIVFKLHKIARNGIRGFPERRPCRTVVILPEDQPKDA